MAIVQKYNDNVMLWNGNVMTTSYVSIIPYKRAFLWPDANSDGLGDGWTASAGAGSRSIVTGNGFSGRAQRFEHVAGTTTQTIYYTGITAIAGKTYIVKGKFRAGHTLWRIYLRSSSDWFTLSMGARTGDAGAFAFSVVAAGSTEIILNFLRVNAAVTSWLEVDEIELYKS